MWSGSLAGGWNRILDEQEKYIMKAKKNSLKLLIKASKDYMDFKNYKLVFLNEKEKNRC